jgi:DNA phosphorothioation-dependent restriction protein DptG
MSQRVGQYIQIQNWLNTVPKTDANKPLIKAFSRALDEAQSGKTFSDGKWKLIPVAKPIKNKNVPK